MLTLLLVVACALAFFYQLVALVAALVHLRRPDPPAGWTPPLSILKPIHGRDPGFWAAIESHAAQDYPEFEILFGVQSDADPAIADIRRLQAAYPRIPIRLVISTTRAANSKVGVLADLAREARHDTLLVNDSDIAVPAGYLRHVVAPLADPDVGVVTCLYRAAASRLPGLWEALGIATDFAPSTLVAPLVGVKEFGLGSTLVFRRADLDAIGGFAAIQDYIADDYQLACRITRLGRRVHLSRVVVETQLQGDRFRDVWSHQVRWHRTIRVSRGAYVGLPVTHAALWAALAFAARLPWLGAALLAIRMAMAMVAGWGVLRSPVVLRYWYLIPLRDLWGVAVWAAGLTGSTVQWRDLRLKLTSDGRIQTA